MRSPSGRMPSKAVGGNCALIFNSPFRTTGRAAALPRWMDLRRLPIQPPSFELLHDWGEAADCAGDERQALALFRRAQNLKVDDGLVASQIGMVLAKQKRYDEALAELDKAQQHAPGLAAIYAYRGNIYFAQGQFAKAVDEYKQALGIDSENRMAIDGIVAARKRLGASPQ